MSPRPRRSALYMPGSNARAIEKARGLAVDAIILDLEDSVAPEAKASARAQACAAVAAGGFGPREVVIRVNGLDTPWGNDDVQAAAAAGPDAVLLPKASSAADIDRLTDLLRRAGAPERTRVWAMIETTLGILNLPDIAVAARHPGARLACFVVGLNDLVKETRIHLDDHRTAALYWLSASVTAARAHGLDVLDGVWNNFRDMEGYRRECLQGRALGFDGKTLIHPDQAGPANAVFQPDPTEVAWGRKIIAAFDQPENKGRAVIGLEGRMVELLHRDAALRTVAIADAIAARG
ncbi:MAG: CoA ester lyase [Hyphomicrobiaceae bacterium]|nr:CoA ester lyase [Hyphomicrobiaceae bacterium]